MSVQLTTPRRQSNSQFQTVIAATTGIAQASSIEIWMMMRTALLTAFISRASSTPMTTVTEAVTRQNAIERATTTHMYGSEKRVM